MADGKNCSWPGCKKTVDWWRWGCSTHWHMLPPNIQEKIQLKMQGAEHEAQDWVVRTFGAQTRERWDPGKWERLVRFVRERDDARRRRRERAELDAATKKAPEVGQA